MGGTQTPSPVMDDHPTEVASYTVALLGAQGVGKTALISQFMTSECINAYERQKGKLRGVNAVEKTPFITAKQMTVAQLLDAFTPEETVRHRDTRNRILIDSHWEYAPDLTMAESPIHTESKVHCSLLV